MSIFNHQQSFFECLNGDNLLFSRSLSRSLLFRNHGNRTSISGVVLVAGGLEITIATLSCMAIDRLMIALKTETFLTTIKPVLRATQRIIAGGHVWNGCESSLQATLLHSSWGKLFTPFNLSMLIVYMCKMRPSVRNSIFLSFTS